jgi:arylsulfatase A
MLWTVSSGLASFRITLIGLRQRLNAAVFPGGIFRMDRRHFLATVGSTVLVSPALEKAGLMPSLDSAEPAAEAPAKPPNIIIMICDDLGYGDLGCYGSSILTPNLDRMAAEGVRFTRYNSAHPVCSASRAALLTGRYGTRSGVAGAFIPDSKDGLSLDERTLADILKERGYTTKCIGKWHLGHTEHYLPTRRGFDDFYGVPYSVDNQPLPLMRNTTVLEKDTDRELLTPRYAEEAVKFIRSHKNDPFFLYFAFNYPHHPMAASPRFRGKSKYGIYGDTVEEIDWGAGQILNALKENGLHRDTLVLFTSDHGPMYLGSPGNFKGRKLTTYEGGVRVPFLAKWTGHIPAGRTSQSWISELDVLPTVTKLCHAQLPPLELDGIDATDLLTCQKDNIQRDALLYFFPWDLQCARWMNWKLRFANFNLDYYNGKAFSADERRANYFLYRPELYNLEDDPGEHYDVAFHNQDIVKAIMSQVETKIRTFPQNVQDIYQAAKHRVGSPLTELGRYPQPQGYTVPDWIYIQKEHFQEEP